MGSLASVFFFFGMVVLVFAIIGMELWGGQYYNFPEGYPRANFDTIGQAMLLWFSVTTAESWPNQMWNTLRPNIRYQYTFEHFNKWVFEASDEFFSLSR
jgi:hypothetical protein